MDYGEPDNGASGRFPEFGTIFLSNTQTMKESLKRNIFALPSSYAEFVKHIKAGIFLFLFEFRKRELFGVYQASSDGGVDIAPHAFSYSGQHFPAQVHVRRIWNCDPLSEKEFKGAIIENYVSAKRFNLGLSEEQVRRLLYLFSSRKKMPPQPQAETIVEVAVKNRRLIGDIKELSEREYITPTEYDEHVSSLARGREDEGLVDNRISAEGKVYPFSQGDFLSKRRRIGKEGRFITNRVAENGVYSHLYERTFCADSPVDCLDEVRTLANTGKVLPVQMANEDKIENLVQSSEYFLDPLDMHDDYTSIQWSTLPDDCQQTFVSDHYGNPVGQSKRVIDGDRFLANDCARRDCTIDPVTSVALSDDNLDVCRQAIEIEKDKQWLKNRERKLRYPFDCDDSTFSAIDSSVSLFNRIRKTVTADRFQIDENEPNLGTCSVEPSTKNVLHPWHCGYRIIEGRKYPNVDGILTENMVDKVPSIMVTSAGYFPDLDRQMLDDARLIKSERLHNQEASRAHTNPIMAMRYPSIPRLEYNSSSFSDKILVKQHSQFTPFPKFDRATFDDATITRTVPYLPDYPNLSHGELLSSNEANQNYTSMQKKHPCDGSLGNFYPQSSYRLQQYSLKSEKSSSRPLDTAIEFEDNGFATSPSGLQSSLLRGSSNSLANPNFSTDMDLNISAPVNYRGSLSSKLSPPCTDLENEGKKGLLHYYCKSRDHHFAFDGKLHEASENQSKHVPQHGMAMPSSQDFSYSEPNDLGMDICRLEGRLPSNNICRLEGRLPSNMNPRALHKNSGAKSTSRRTSVFSRLSSKEKEPSDFGEERKGIEVNHQDCYMDATADEVTALLKPDDNLSVKKLRKSQVVGQPRESAVSEKKLQLRMETNPSTVEKRILNSANQEATTGSIDEIYKETRILDFKRRSIRKKSWAGTGASSTSHSNCIGAKEEAKSSTNPTLRRKKLIRPAFGRIDTASYAAAQGNETLQIPARIHGNDNKQSFETDTLDDPAARDDETLQTPALIQDKDDKQSSEMDTASDAAIRGDDTLQTHAPIEDKDDKQGSETDTAGDAGTKGSDTLLPTPALIHDEVDKQISEIDTASDAAIRGDDTLQTHASIEDKDDKQNSETDTAGDAGTKGSDTLQTAALIHDKVDKQSSETDTVSDAATRVNETLPTPDLVHDKDDKQIEAATSLCESVVLVSSNVLASCNHPEEQQDAVAHVLSSQSIDLDGYEHGDGDSSSEVLNKTSEQITFVIQTSSVAGVSPKDTDATFTGLNLPEPSLEKVELDTGLNLPEPSLEQVELATGCRNNLTEEKHLSKMKIILTKKDVKASSQ